MTSEMKNEPTAELSKTESEGFRRSKCAKKGIKIQNGYQITQQTAVNLVIISANISESDGKRSRRGEGRNITNYTVCLYLLRHRS